jgi:hypothetical protein
MMPPKGAWHARSLSSRGRTEEIGFEEEASRARA